MNECEHTSVTCINPYEIIRKYRCSSCGEVMICACDEEFAHRFLPHQLSEGTELRTRRRVPVTIGFQKYICNTCRGLPEESHPKAEIYGQSSKIRRYYWREILRDTMKRFGDWADKQGYVDYFIARQENPDTYDQINRSVVEEIKELHNRAPKYTYNKEKSQAEVLQEHNIEIVRLDVTYAKRAGRRVGILDGGEIYSAEEFVALHYRQQGYDVLFTESRPFHVIFGVFMWLVVQDPTDSRVRIVSFGDRTAFEAGRESELIWTHLPEDFGAPAYAQRRASAIDEHFSAIFDSGNEELLWLFDYWLEPSEHLRQYLWAHRAEDIEKARAILSLLPADDIYRILRYLVEDYWRRYVGWPDLIIYTQDHLFFAEVKSSRDKLSEDQKNWIDGNSTELHLPFKLVKLHRKAV